MKIVAVMACPAGAAHTYMSAESLQIACEKRGIECHVETQGITGIDNRITAQDIEESIGSILSLDVKISDAERFQDKPVVETYTTNIIRNADKFIDQLIEKANGTGDQGKDFANIQSGSHTKKSLFGGLFQQRGK